MINSSYIPGENQEKGRKRAQMVDPLVLLLHGHPLLHLLSVPLLPPSIHVHNHDPRVEIARIPSLEGAGQSRVGPEIVGEIESEIGVAIFGGGHYFSFHVSVPELGYVVNNNEVGVQIDDALHVLGNGVSEVYPGVIQGLVQGLSNGLGYLAANPVRVEAVRERGFYAGEEFRRVGVGGQEVEGQVLRTGRMLDHGEYRRHGAAEVVGV
ncbi:hypothetical protein CR513_57550, partial [Mucuna pruriens]